MGVATINEGSISRYDMAFAQASASEIVHTDKKIPMPDAVIILRQCYRQEEMRREPVWTMAIAVGSEDLVRQIAALRSDRFILEIYESANVGWYVRDPMACYCTAIDSAMGMQAGPDQALI